MNYLKSFLIKGKMRIKMRSRLRRRVADAAVLDLKSSLAKLAVELTAEFCKRF